MSTSELQNLEKNIQRLKEQLSEQRDTLVTNAPGDKMRIKQRMEDLRRDIRELEREKWELIATMSADLSISDREAEPIVAEIVTEVETITVQSPDRLPAEILELSRQILAKLNEPEQPASAKLKAAISALPPFVSLSYEAELDTEITFKRYFPTFNRFLAGVKDRLKK